MITLLAYLLLAIVVSFLCSIMESVLLSISPSFLITEQEKGHHWAAAMSGLKDRIDKPLSAILTLNTVAHTIGAAGVGAEAVKLFGQAYFGIASVVLTILILIFTEIIPKTIGARYWRGLAKVSYYIIRGMIIITYPLVIMSGWISRLFSRKTTEMTTSREEIAALSTIGTEEGIFTEEEDKIIQNLLKLRNIKAKEIMTPRVVVTSANEDLELEEFLENKEYFKFSRIPVYSGQMDHITGYVIRQHVLEKLAEKQKGLRLKDVSRKIVVAHSSIAVTSLWKLMLENKEHIALIIDEYGGLDGIVTMEDIIETLLGLEIVDEKDTVKDMREYARQKWQKRKDGLR